MYIHIPKIYLVYWSFPEDGKETHRGIVETQGGTEGKWGGKVEREWESKAKRWRETLLQHLLLKTPKSISRVLLQNTDMIVEQLNQNYSRVLPRLRLRYITYVLYVCCSAQKLFQYFDIFRNHFQLLTLKPEMWDSAVHKAVSQVTFHRTVLLFGVKMEGWWLGCSAAISECWAPGKICFLTKEGFKPQSEF